MKNAKKQNLPLLEKATELAFKAHKGQVRKATGIPYVNHLCEVTSRVSHYLWDYIPGDCRDTELKDKILSAAMLHDYIEDCGGTYEILEKEFGAYVACIVLECSRNSDKNSDLGKYEFLESFRNKSTTSVLIKIADRYCNVNDYKRTPGKQIYASKYALQAYPIYQAFLSKKKEIDANYTSDHIWPRIQNDLDNLQKIISDVYAFSIFDDNQEDFVKQIMI